MDRTSLHETGLPFAAAFALVGASFDFLPPEAMMAKFAKRKPGKFPTHGVRALEWAERLCAAAAQPGDAF